MIFAKKGYSTLPYGQLHYRSTAQKPGLPLVLLHQTPSSSTMYVALMAELAPDFRCIAPDTPGFGQSDPLVEGVTVKGWSTAVSSFLHSLNIERCYLFGHHTGASIAVQMAADHPDLVAKLALSGPPLLTDAQIAHLKTTLPTTELDENGRFLSDIWDRLRHKNPIAPLELSLRETIAALQCRDGYHDAYYAVFEQDFAGQLAALRCPVLLMAGENDSLRASLEPAARLVKNGRFHIIPNAGTYSCDEQPQAVATLLRDFFRS